MPPLPSLSIRQRARSVLDLELGASLGVGSPTSFPGGAVEVAARAQGLTTSGSSSQCADAEADVPGAAAMHGWLRTLHGAAAAAVSLQPASRTETVIFSHLRSLYNSLLTVEGLLVDFISNRHVTY